MFAKHLSCGKWRNGCGTLQTAGAKDNYESRTWGLEHKGAVQDKEPLVHEFSVIANIYWELITFQIHF